MSDKRQETLSWIDDPMGAFSPAVEKGADGTMTDSSDFIVMGRRGAYLVVHDAYSSVFLVHEDDWEEFVNG